MFAAGARNRVCLAIDVFATRIGLRSAARYSAGAIRPSRSVMGSVGITDLQDPQSCPVYQVLWYSASGNGRQPARRARVATRAQPPGRSRWIGRGRNGRQASYLDNLRNVTVRARSIHLPRIETSLWGVRRLARPLKLIAAGLGIRSARVSRSPHSSQAFASPRQVGQGAVPIRVGDARQPRLAHVALEVASGSV